jgi:beta,beta-carotene 9',10'-dioxygenase
MTETPHQHVIDADTLRSRGLYEYDDGLPAQLSMSAHPHYDRSREALVNVGTTLGPKSELCVYRQGWSSHKREVEGRLPLKRVPYLHAFGLTAGHAVLIDHPFSVNPLRMLFSNRGYIEHFAWQPQRGTRLYKLDRTTGAFSVYETESLFCFHTVNTFEDNGDVVFDFLGYDDESVVRLLRREQLLRGLPDLAPRLLRARLQPGAKSVRLEQLSSTRFEFPQIAYRQHSGQTYGHVWGARLQSSAGHAWSSELVHVELATDRVQRFSEDDLVLGEPVFVQRPGSSSETDGVLLAVGTHREKQLSVLLVLDADRLELLARCEVEAAIPLGFHGNFAFETGR